MLRAVMHNGQRAALLDGTTRALKLSLFLAAMSVSAASLAKEPPPPPPASPVLIGDVAHGEALLKKVDGVRVDGAWLNAASDETNLAKLEAGADGFVAIGSDNVLDRWDALAALRAKNADLRALAMGANHVLVSQTSLDENADKRLKEQGKLKTFAAARRVFALYKLEGVDGMVYVADKDTKKRDKLKKDTKVGYVVFVKIPGYKGGDHEAAIALDKDVHITAIEVRAPDGTMSVDANQAAQRFVGKGARGKYEALKPGGNAKALPELAAPLSDAYLEGVESVYMFEVAERDYFAFGD